MSENRQFPALCRWIENGPDESWTLQVDLPASSIPAEAAPEVGQEIFFDLNGVTDRRNVPGGIMVRRPAGDEGGDGADGADATRYSIELAVPRGYRGALRFLPVPRGLQVADRPTWLDVLERGFVPAGDHDLLTVTDMRRKQVLELAAPDARPLVWTGGDALTSNAVPGAGEGRSDVDEQVVTLGSAPRRIWTHRPQRGPASAPVLVVFDGERFIRGGLLAAIDELVAPPSAVIAVDHAPVGDDGPDEDAVVGQRADDLVMNSRFCDDVLALVRRTAPVSTSTIVAGASYGGLAAAYFSLRHPEAFRGICLSPSFWESDDQGRRIWDLSPSGVDGKPGGTAGEPESRESEARTATAARPTFSVDHGILETVIADSVAEATEEFAARGIDFAPRPFMGGHEYLW